ncbi:hypothetical protein ACYOEI_03565 [Singulisphaera rosea]
MASAPPIAFLRGFFGLYLDNTVGWCGSVGLGELNLLNGTSYLCVEFLRQGKSAKDALLLAAERVEEVTPRDPRFRDEDGKLSAGVALYVLTKDGQYAGWSTGGGPAGLVVADGNKVGLVQPEVFRG